MRALQILWHYFFQICLFRLAPQDLPASTALLGLTLAFYAGLGLALNLGTLTPFEALLAILSDSLLLAAFTAVALYLVKHPARLLQTLIALFGTGTVFSVLNAPPIYWLDWVRQSGEGDPGLPAIFLLLLLGWNLSVTAHILRHALSTYFGVGLSLAFLYTLLSAQMWNSLFGPA